MLVRQPKKADPSTKRKEKRRKNNYTESSSIVERRGGSSSSLSYIISLFYTFGRWLLACFGLGNDCFSCFFPIGRPLRIVQKRI